MDLERFVATYGMKEPQKIGGTNELKPLGSGCPVKKMGKSPAEADIYVSKSSLGKLGLNLWVFSNTDIPYIRESPGLPCSAGDLKHTNLTGGKKAACGGELWVDTDDKSHLYLNGASGRYGPNTEQELSDAVSVFRDLGYQVTSFGWDHDTGKPARVLRS